MEFETIFIGNESHYLETLNKLSDLSKVIVPGYDLSIPNTIDLIVKEKLSSSKGTITQGPTDDTETAQKA